MKEFRGTHLERLREKAETVLIDRFKGADRISLEDARAMIDDVQVYQAELEIQNEELRAAQKALEQSRDRFYQLFHRAPVGYVIIDTAGMMIDVNRTLSEMLLTERHTMLNKPFSTFVVQEDRPQYFARLKSFLKRPGRKTIEVRLDRNGEPPIYARLEGRFFHPDAQDADHFSDQVLITVNDISDMMTAKKQLEAALAETDEKFRELSALLACSRAVLEHQDFEAAARKIFDAAKAEIGATAGYVALLNADGDENELLFLDAGNRPCTVDQELPMPIRGLRAESYKTGNVVYDNRFETSEWMRFMPEGHVTLDNVLFAPLTLEGTVLGLIGLANKPGGFSSRDAQMAKAFGEFAAIALRNSRSLEMRDLAMDNLRESKDRLSNILNSISDGFLSLDEDLVVTFFNRAAGGLLHRNPEDIIGESIFEAFPEARDSIFEDLYTKAVKQKKFASCETYFDKEPYTGWYELRVYPAREGISVFFQSTTEKKKTQERLRQAQKMEAINTITGGIAHEFNNLISIILWSAELAGEDIPGDSSVRAQIKQIHDACLRGKNIVKRLRDFTQPFKTAPKRVNLRALVEKALRAPDLPVVEGIEIVCPADIVCDDVMGNPEQIRQAVTELITNALHAMEKHGGRLEFTASNIEADSPLECFDCVLETGRYILLQVMDTGIGITPEDAKRVFDPYFTTKERAQVSGMGLTVVHGIMRGHGGGVSIESRPGCGTIVNCYFPATGQAVKAPQVSTPQAPIEGLSILLVDDEESICVIGKMRLERMGHRVKTFSNPFAAVDCFLSDPNAFDILITDYSMPKMKGDQLIRTVSKARPDIKTILCTGFNENFDRNQLSQIGVNAVLPKPHGKDQLRATILGVMRQTLQ
jgi:PAS domain S-box-containing protein